MKCKILGLGGLAPGTALLSNITETSWRTSTDGVQLMRMREKFAQEQKLHQIRQLPVDKKELKQYWKL